MRVKFRNLKDRTLQMRQTTLSMNELNEIFVHYRPIKASGMIISVLM